MIPVLIAENHSVVRAGLEGVLENADDIEVVGAAADGEEAVALARERHPAVVLMDLSMPVMGGIEATRLILDADPGARVVVLTAFSDRELILEALDAGAIGYLLKDTEPAELLNGIRAASRGESPLAPKAGRALLSSREDRRSAELSDREMEVLALVANGLANKLIARRLEISEKTVKAHLTKVFQRIGVSDRTQAALWAQRHGIGAPQAERDASDPADGGAAR
jgi:Response regulator containing a CheY-like receiver domain and an HTH DNA-binding domain